MKKAYISFAISIASLLISPLQAEASYWLIIGSYRQGPGSRPEVSGITSPSLYAIPMESMELCEKAGTKITEEIYKPVWQFDNKWSCIKSAK
ncbi:hypothetical protein [Prochlorococcus marinus]|uniref:hypothetical protein n=1 Tax=Prochlorococcus marinus TaxID=1219 RepID=UPI0022B36F30|nr:hypothetical protein [Prochlorococcus marinus]